MTKTAAALGLEFRYDVTRNDPAAVRRIIESTDFFSSDEADVAVELVDERLAKGAASGYHFVFAESSGSTIGYACYGQIACTVGSYDLYWIAVDREHQRLGAGRLVLAEAERLIRESAGRHIYVETSGRPQYVPTRSFYERSGYHVATVLKDFYNVNDDKVVFLKILDGSGPR